MVTRRSLLGSIGAGTTLLAGCTGSSSSDGETQDSTETETEPTETESSGVNLSENYNPPCDGEDHFIKVIELNKKSGGTEVVLENRLNTKAYIDFISVKYGSAGQEEIINKEFWITARGVEAFTVNISPNEIDGVVLSTDTPYKSGVQCQ